MQSDTTSSGVVDVLGVGSLMHSFDRVAAELSERISSFERKSHSSSTSSKSMPWREVVVLILRPFILRSKVGADLVARSFSSTTRKQSWPG